MKRSAGATATLPPIDRKTRKLIVGLANEVEKAAERRRDPHLDIPTRSLSNVRFNKSLVYPAILSSADNTSRQKRCTLCLKINGLFLLGHAALYNHYHGYITISSCRRSLWPPPSATRLSLTTLLEPNQQLSSSLKCLRLIFGMTARLRK